MDWARTTVVTTDEGDKTIQSSKAWNAWRGKGLGSSDAAALLGWSPWRNIVELWEEKTGRSKPLFSEYQLSAMERGKRLEPEIRKWFEKETGALYPDGIAEHPELTYMRASFDGRNTEHDRVLEIKAPNAKDHAEAIAGRVPDKYLAQCQWLMLVGRHKYCSYVSYGSDGTYAVVNIEADPVMQEELKRRAALFWPTVSASITPPDPALFKKWERPLSAPVDLTEHPAIAEQELEAMVAETLKAAEEVKKAEAKLEAAKVNLKQYLELRGLESTVVGQAAFGWSTRKGSIDYSAVPELKAVDLEQYRKPDVRLFYFKRKEA